MSGQLSIAVVDLDEVERGSGAREDGAENPERAPAGASTAERERVSTPPVARSERTAAALRVTDGDHLAERALNIVAREFLELPVRLLVALPLSTTALCRAEGVEVPIVITTAQKAYVAARKRRWPVFLGSELAAIALAAEHGRLVPVDLVRWCDRKAEDPGWKLTEAAAHGLGEVVGRSLASRGWKFGSVLRAASVEVLDVIAGAEEGAELVEGWSVGAGEGDHAG